MNRQGQGNVDYEKVNLRNICYFYISTINKIKESKPQSISIFYLQKVLNLLELKGKEMRKSSIWCPRKLQRERQEAGVYREGSAGSVR